MEHRVSILGHTGSVNIGLSCACVSMFQSCGCTACCSATTCIGVPYLPMSSGPSDSNQLPPAYSINTQPIQSLGPHSQPIDPYRHNLQKPKNRGSKAGLVGSLELWVCG